MIFAKSGKSLTKFVAVKILPIFSCEKKCLCQLSWNDNLPSLECPKVLPDTRMNFVKENTKQKVVFAYCNTPQWSDKTRLLNILRKEGEIAEICRLFLHFFRMRLQVNIPSLALIH